MSRYEKYVEEIKIKNRFLLFVIPIIFVFFMRLINKIFFSFLGSFLIIGHFWLKGLIKLDYFLLLSNIITQIFMTLLTFFLMKKVLKLSLGKFKFSEVLKSYSLGTVFGILLITTVFIIILLLNGITIYSNPNVNYFSLISYLIFFIFQGINEELWFRGLLPFLSKAIGNKFAVILSSAFFMMVHLANPNISYLALFNIFVAGLMFAFIYLYAGNIWLIGAIHSFWNFFISNVYGSQVSGIDISDSILFSIPNFDKDLISGGLFGFEASIITLIIEIGITLFICYKIKNRKEKRCLQEQED